MNQTAQGLAALGRGPDTMLVHMAPEEVAGLQALALKHGGTLTINPETGLAEAGFLKNILPMVAGFALNAFAPGVGTAVGSMFGLGSAAGTALTVGGIAGLTSGNLEKGLMAGLGAYGGAGLAEGFANAGTGAMSSGATVDPRAVVPQAPVFEAAVPAATSGASNISAGAAGAIPQTIVDSYGQIAANPAFSPIPTTTPYPIALDQSAANIGNVYAQEQAAQNAVAKALANKTDLVSAGFDVAKNDPGAFLKKNMLPLGALGIAALSGSDDKNVPTPSNPGLIRPYTYSRTKVSGAFDRTPNDPMSSRERQYFNDQYTAQTPYRAPGPEYMAVGGPVEDMSNGNDMAAYMGQDKFDQGGSVGGYTYDPRTGLYTKPGGEGATTVAPTGGLSGASGDSGGSGVPSGPIPITTPEEFAEQSARNQKLNDFLTEVLPTVLSPFSTMARGLYSTPLAGGIANFFGSRQDPSLATVGDMGTYAVGPAMQSMQDAYNADMSAAQAQSISDQSSAGASDAGTGYGTGDTSGGFGEGQYAKGGIANLGSYSDGGRLLRGPGDGVSDSIPAMIGQKQQARLADGEFVVPARIVSELGNGSTEAGARQLYAMMDRVQKARRKTVGKDKVATNSRAARLLPA